MMLAPQHQPLTDTWMGKVAEREHYTYIRWFSRPACSGVDWLVEAELEDTPMDAGTESWWERGETSLRVDGRSWLSWEATNGMFELSQSLILMNWDRLGKSEGKHTFDAMTRSEIE